VPAFSLAWKSYVARLRLRFSPTRGVSSGGKSRGNDKIAVASAGTTIYHFLMATQVFYGVTLCNTHVGWKGTDMLPEYFEFSLPTKLVYGIGIIENLGEAVKPLGKRKAILVTDEILVKTGLVEKVKTDLKPRPSKLRRRSIRCRPTPPSIRLKNVPPLQEKKGCDMFIAVGGGSVIDTAKVANLLAVKGGKLQDHMGAYLLDSSETAASSHRHSDNRRNRVGSHQSGRDCRSGKRCKTTVCRRTISSTAGHFRSQHDGLNAGQTDGRHRYGCPYPCHRGLCR
jgi:hypothetical protein